jgi:outer membrane protein assembly factor BamD (BamD/ComL family)
LIAEVPTANASPHHGDTLMKMIIVIMLVSILYTGCETVTSQQVPEKSRTQEELLFQSGLDALDDYDLYSAERYFREVLAINPRNYDARFYLHEVSKKLER